jgi:hypothetical protein
VVSVRVERAERVIGLLMESAQRYRADAQIAPEGPFHEDAAALEHIARAIRDQHTRRMELFKARPELAPREEA